uniref:Uncharacterized protein n=1 Tax=Cacopsylla melanoneura TaxID=428564 RepID=A0A8D8Y1G6_9HEMI
MFSLPPELLRVSNYSIDWPVISLSVVSMLVIVEQLMKMMRVLLADHLIYPTLWIFRRVVKPIFRTNKLLELPRNSKTPCKMHASRRKIPKFPYFQIKTHEFAFHIPRLKNQKDKRDMLKSHFLFCHFVTSHAQIMLEPKTFYTYHTSRRIYSIISSMSTT